MASRVFSSDRGSEGGGADLLLAQREAEISAIARNGDSPATHGDDVADAGQGSDAALMGRRFGDGERGRAVTYTTSAAKCPRGDADAEKGKDGAAREGKVRTAPAATLGEASGAGSIVQFMSQPSVAAASREEFAPHAWLLSGERAHCCSAHGALPSSSATAAAYRRRQSSTVVASLRHALLRGRLHTTEPASSAVAWRSPHRQDV